MARRVPVTGYAEACPVTEGSVNTVIAIDNFPCHCEPKRSKRPILHNTGKIALALRASQ